MFWGVAFCFCVRRSGVGCGVGLCQVLISLNVFIFFPSEAATFLVHLSFSFSLSFSLFFFNIESTARFPPPRDVQVKFKPEGDFEGT